jgi:O-antigen ligase
LLGRSTGINFAILLIAALYFMDGVWRRRTLVIFCICYVVFAFTAPWIIPPLFQALSGTSLLDIYPGTFAARLELWGMVSQHVKDAWLFGHGADTVRIATYIVQNPKYYHLPDLPSAHSMVFDLWFELGLIGILVLAAIIIEIARRILRLTGAAQLVCISIFLATIIELSVDHRIWLSWMQGTLIFGVCVCVLAILRQRAHRQQCVRG